MRAQSALLAALLAVPAAASAGPMTGSFSAIATSGSFASSPTTNIAGTIITGSFAVSTAGGYTPAGLPAGEYLLPLTSVVLSYDVAAINQAFAFPGIYPSEPSAIFLSQTGNTQTADLVPEFVQPHDDNALVLTGPAGSLFTNLDDLASFHLGAGVSILSPESLSVFDDGGATFDITSEAFAQPVPEPASGLLLAGALLGLLGAKKASSPFLKKGPKLSLLRLHQQHVIAR